MNEYEIKRYYKESIDILQEIMNDLDYEIMEKLIYDIAKNHPVQFVISYRFIKRDF